MDLIYSNEIIREMKTHENVKNLKEGRRLKIVAVPLKKAYMEIFSYMYVLIPSRNYSSSFGCSGVTFT